MRINSKASERIFSNFHLHHLLLIWNILQIQNKKKINQYASVPEQGGNDGLS